MGDHSVNKPKKPAAPVLKVKATVSQTSSEKPTKMGSTAKKSDVHRNSPACSETLIVHHDKVVEHAESLDCRKKIQKDGHQEEDVKERDRLASTCAVESAAAVLGVATKSKAELKAERRALQEAQRAVKDVSTVNDETTATRKSKAEMRAERRALQESQRAAKAVVKPIAKNKRTSETSDKKESKAASKHESVAVAVVAKPKEQPTKTTKQIKLFSHLPAYKRDVSVVQAVKDEIHLAIVQLGLKYAEGVICGSNARCVALISALQKVIHDFRTPKNKEISHALPEMILDPSMNFLENCRPVSVGMKNVAKKLREEIANLDKQLTEDEAKKHLDDVLNTFRTDSIEKAHEAIVNLAMDKITSNDIILTYGSSHVVKQVLVAAHKNAKFRVIVVDSRPKLEGRKMFEYLIREGIKCSYILINAVSYAMQEATKVLLGAHALLANGYVMSRVGSSQVALVAKAYNKPVLVCCETYKFCELVQTDSFVVNELGDPNDLVMTSGRTNPLESWIDVPKLNILNPYYDVTPPDLITVVINDVCLVPCTSAPVLLRVRPTRK